MSDKPWGGRFLQKTDRKVEAFTSSIEIDRHLYAYDIEGSSAHCQMLAKSGIITEEEASGLVQGLGQIKREIERGQLEFDPGLEDIHMHIEARLIQLVGKLALKLHTARSRNDQVALDVRMYLREETRRIIKDLTAFRKTLVDLAKAHLDVIMPGYTHLQRAQPVLFAHHLMAYYEMFSRDAARFSDSLKRTNVMPLGAAALAGTPYPIDRAYTAELLDFPEVSANSIDSVADRDFIIEFLAGASICMVHLSRLSEELVLWSSSEFGFIALPDSFATGSSIMPQKKNPDVPEIVRGKTGGVFGDLIALLVTMKSLPLAYNRDMQEDKKYLFNAVGTLKACLGIYTQMMPRIIINAEAMRTAASFGYLNATDMADYLVSQGLPFREAHDCVGRAVAFGLEQKRELHELTVKEMKTFSPHFKADIYESLSLKQMVNRRTSFGGTAPKNVAAAIRAAEEKLNQELGKKQNT